MALSFYLLQALGTLDPAETWSHLFQEAWDIMSDSLPPSGSASEISRRDQRVGELDLYLASAGWDLWGDYEAHVPHTSQALREWWNQHHSGRAVLILDGLSLREVPWILHGARTKGYTVLAARSTGAELPAETTPFAKALGFGQRSDLENNGASKGHAFPGARTDSLALPWADCAAKITHDPDWVLWHHWPDRFLHDTAEAGRGLDAMVKEAAAHLGGEPFWQLVGRLATGRRVVITSDHGYAACGHFVDLAEQQSAWMKEHFKAGRRAVIEDGAGPFVPPIDLALNTAHGHVALALGRRKWRAPGGYPGLTHGGLSLLEVASPWVELYRPGAGD